MIQSKKKRRKKRYMSFVRNKNFKKAKEYVGDELKGSCENLGMDSGLLMENGL